MAWKGIKDFDSGIRAFKDALYVYHERKSFYLGLTFDGYIQEKVTIKARQFNTILNRSIEAEEQASIDKDAAEYRETVRRRITMDKVSLPLPAIRCLSKEEAAQYLGIGVTLLTEL